MPTKEKYILALDQGTTSSRAIIFNEAGTVIGLRQTPSGNPASALPTAKVSAGSFAISAGSTERGRPGAGIVGALGWSVML